MPTVDAKDKAEPVFALFSEARPADGATECQFITFNTCFFADFAAHSGNDILAGFQLAAQAVVFARVEVTDTTGAMDQQHASRVGRHDISERREDGSERHSGPSRSLAR